MALAALAAFALFGCDKNDPPPSTALDQRVYEIPARYTVAALLKQAMNQNFDSPIQFQRVVQAKLRTETAYRNLLPHLEINDVLNIAALNLLGYLKAVGDLVPFLFPTRWLETKADQYKLEAEFDAWILTKADAMNLAEGLAYSALRDDIVLSAIQDYQIYLAGIRDKVRERERAGLLQIGSSDDIASIINNLDRGNAVLSENAVQERISLAQAAGFRNFAAISGIQPPDDEPIDDIQPYDDATIKRLADLSLDRSYERRQMAALINASRVNQKASYFQWLDPAGERDGSLGINLGSYVKIAKSETQELLAKKEKLEAVLTDSVARAASLSNQYLASYQLARAGVDIQDRRVKRHSQNMETGINFAMSDLTNSLQEKLKAEIELVQAQYNYYVARANLNRLLLAGPYAVLPTEHGQPSWIIATTNEKQ